MALFKNSSTVVKYLFSVKHILFQQQNVRSLYSPITLGMDNFLAQRERAKLQLSNIKDKFREKMIEYSSDGSKNMVFTEDLKNMVYLVESDTDVDLLIKMMKRFNQQNKELRFGNFVFGPVVMRMFYNLKKSNTALECFNSPELNGFFDQLMSYQLLLDMLYEEKRYDDILKVFDIIKDKQLDATRYPKNIVVLVMAACYKMNTKESLEYALKLWSDLASVGHKPMRRATTFCAALALNKGKPDVAIEILTTSHNSNYTTVRNLRVAALCAVGRVEDAIPILKSIVQDDTPSMGARHTFNKEVVEIVKKAVESQTNQDLKLEFNRLEAYFNTQKMISDLTLDQQLCTEIMPPPVIGRWDRDDQFPSKRFGRDRFTKLIQRPGLADLQ